MMTNNIEHKYNIPSMDLNRISSISIIVPCKNEERYVARCINAIIEQRNPNVDIEIIVIDNGSTDNTPNILNLYSESIKVLNMPHNSIPEIRNAGGRTAKNDYIAFIDADVEIDKSWLREVQNTITDISAKGMDPHKTIFGSTCTIPNNPTWIESTWFTQLNVRDINNSRYINGANMIMHRSLFYLVGGFNDQYNTGEDEKICEDVKNAGGNIIKNKMIIAIHHGYPKTALQFFKRERWHGKGMDQYLGTPWRSKDLMLSIYYLIVMIFSFSIFLFTDQPIASIAFLIISIFLPLMMLSIRRTEGHLLKTSKLTWLFFIYGLARFVALFDILVMPNQKVPRFKDDNN